MPELVIVSALLSSLVLAFYMYALVRKYRAEPGTPVRAKYMTWMNTLGWVLAAAYAFQSAANFTSDAVFFGAFFGWFYAVVAVSFVALGFVNRRLEASTKRWAALAAAEGSPEQ